jgi:competence protein ComEA
VARTLERPPDAAHADADWTRPAAEAASEAGQADSREISQPGRLRVLAARAAFAAAVLLAVAGAVVWIVRLPSPRAVQIIRPEVTSPAALGSAGPALTDETSPSAGLIDLNAATAAELDALPGIGEARALAIIQFREANGPIRSADDLLAIDGIGPATVDGLRPFVVQP